MSHPIYEPRALWEVMVVDTAETPDQTFVRGQRRFWRNGSKYPWMLTRVAIGAVNYVLREQNISPVVDALDYDNCASVVQKYQLELHAPYRNRFMRRRIPVSSFAASPGWLGTRNDRTAAYKSSLYGAYYKKFEKTLVLPRHGVIEAGLTGWTRLAAPYMTNGDYPRFAYGFHQYAGMAKGAVRMTPAHTLLDANGAGVAPAGPQPFVLDAFGAAGTQVGATSTQAWWPPQHVFKSRDFRQQDPNRGVATDEFYAMSLMLDQMEIDEDLQAGPLVGQLINPLGMNIGCRVRCSAGGTGEWWWREGAPVALVYNDITPALVHELAEPITLEPGQAVEILIQTPSTHVNSSDVEIEPTYKVGVALTGYAIIEG